ncbi:hypothetical protein KEM54_000808 [Ascosphaera aggregata]|nr:hypothetical protein KEM54_000808 [Ascosphaera aggregata]
MFRRQLFSTQTHQQLIMVSESRLFEVTLILSGLLLSYGLYRLLKVGSRPKGIPPGPPTVPILGNLHLMNKDKPWALYERWAKEYGPVYSLMLGTRVRIILSSDQAVKDLLDRRSSIYSGRPSMYIGQDVISDGKRFFMSEDMTKWRIVRKMVHAVLNINATRTYLPYQDLESKIMLDSMIDRPDDFDAHLKRFSYSFMTQMVYGFRCPSFQDERLRLLFETLREWSKSVESVTAQMLDAYPVFQKLPACLSPIVRRGKRLHQVEAENFTHHWLETKQRLEQGDNLTVEGWDDETAAYVCASILSAGSETSSSSQYAFIAAMALYPDVQRRAQEEIDRVVDSDRLPTFDDYEHLPYIRCCIKENLRWCPLTFLGVPHATTEEDYYMGYRIPKGAIVSANIWTINMSEARSPNPRVFDPERHADDHTTLFQSAQGDPKKRDSFSFGAGRRQCPGIHIAERTVFLGMARILWGFDIRLKTGPDGRPLKPDVENFTPGLINRPLDFKADILPRDEKRVKVIRQAVQDDEKNLLDPKTKQWRRLPEGVKLPTWTDNLTSEPSEEMKLHGLPARIASDKSHRRVGSPLNVARLSLEEELKHDFNEDDFSQGLCYLDKEVARSKNLHKVLPLRLVAVKGYVSVTSLGNCQTTSQLTYILDPFLMPRPKIQEKLRKAIEGVAYDCLYSGSWMSDQLGQNLSERDLHQLWKNSIKQNVVIWAGENITIYAPLWEWMFDEKMKVLAAASPHADQQDIDDAVDILMRLNKKHKSTISAERLAYWQRDIQPPVRMGMYHNLSEAHKAKYGRPGLLFRDC